MSEWRDILAFGIAMLLWGFGVRECTRDTTMEACLSHYAPEVCHYYGEQKPVLHVEMADE